MLVLAGWYVRRRLIGRVVVYQFERGLVYRNGKLIRQVDAGRYWFMPLRTEIAKLDLRLRTTTVGGQEVLTKDAASLKVSLAAQFEVSDAATATHRTQSFEEALYLELQTALRTLVGASTADDLLARRAEIDTELHAAVAPKAAALGLELHSVRIKDIMFPGEMKKVFSQVMKARKDGQAALERARGETAALRSLANASRLLEANPGLLPLRALQTVAEGSGHTMVFGVPPQTTPVTHTNGHRPGGDGPSSASQSDDAD
jgi:regulator of protease activity HflC (stomatin/prohibitin superfamily)